MTLRLIKKVFLLIALLKVEQVLSCLQHRLIDQVKHGWHFSLLNLFTFKMFLLSKTLLPLRFLLLSFLLLLNAKIRGSAKYANFCQLWFEVR